MTVREIQGHLARTVRHRGLARPDQPGHRRGARRGPGLAEPAAGAGLSGGVLRRAAGQDPRRRAGPNKAVYLALALNPDGEKDVLGLWIEQTEGAKFWLKVFNELKTRGVNDILIAVVDGLKGFPEAIAAVFPQTTVQTCIVHLIRNSLAFVSWKDRKAILPAIKAIYRAENAEAALAAARGVRGRMGQALSGDRPGLAPRLGARHPVLRLPARRSASDLHDQRDRERCTAAAQDHQDARQLPRLTRRALKLLFFLPSGMLRVRWRRPIEWTAAVGQFAILFGDRFEPSAR